MKHQDDSCELAVFAATCAPSALMTLCCASQLREKYVKDEDLRDTKATYRTIRKALATLNDPFTRFLEPQQFAALRRGTAGSVTGVGLEIGFENRGGDSNRIVVRCHTGATFNWLSSERLGLQRVSVEISSSCCVLLALVECGAHRDLSYWIIGSKHV